MNVMSLFLITLSDPPVYRSKKNIMKQNQQILLAFGMLAQYHGSPRMSSAYTHGQMISIPSYWQAFTPAIFDPSLYTLTKKLKPFYT